MKKTIKVISLFVAAMLMLFVFAACKTQEPTQSQSPEKTETKTEEATKEQALADEEPVTLTYWVMLTEQAAKAIQSYSDHVVYIELQKRLGISIEFEHPAIGQEDEQFLLLISTSDLPDIIELAYRSGNLYPGGPDKAIEDGVFLKLNDIIDEYSPNYSALLNGNPEIKLQSTTDEGNIWAFNMVEEQRQPSWEGPVLRKDWLDEFGLELPETIDDWHEFLTMAKEEKDAQAPMLLEDTGVSQYHPFVSAYGVINDFYRDGDQTVHYGSIEDGFKQYLATMNQWYSEGLIDSDFVSGFGDRTNALITTSEAAGWVDGFWTFENYKRLADDPNFTIVPAVYPSLKEGEEVTLRQHNEYVRDNPACITPSCENIEAAATLLDYGYSEEGAALYGWGIEGMTYEVVDGEKVWADFMTKNEDGFTFIETRNIYCRQGGPYIREWWAPLVAYTDVEVGAMNDYWNGDDSGILPNTLTFTAAEGDEYSKIMSDIDTYKAEMIVNFIMGIEPLDGFDEYAAQIKSMGIDNAIAIKQAALDRYNNR